MNRTLQSGPRFGRLAFALVGASLGWAASAPADGGKLEYNRDVRPILAENCFACHGPDSAARKASLRIDRREDAIKSEVLMPGKPDESELIARLLADDPKEHMPPPATKKVLTPAQVETLKRWVAEGAEYQPHWSYIPPKSPAIPKVREKAWVRNPIDAFILRKLEDAGLTPAPEADRRTLARRLSLDLTGLPPSPEQVESFANDKSPDYFEKYVDSLLDSAAYGEHRARYWLDAARYADTHGLHFDNYREMWSYRDWVIKALNANIPFDRFATEQIAGDLLPGATVDQLVATGFNRCNISTNEGGTIPDENLVLYTRDRTETVGQVFLGLTVGCAVCHDHKFDPISQRDFYAMAAFFNNSNMGAMDGNIKDTPPIVPVPRAEDRPRFEALVKELAQVRTAADERTKAARGAFDQWLAQAKPEALAAAAPAQGLKLHQTLGFAPTDGLTVRPGQELALADFGDFDAKQAFSFGAWIKLPDNNKFGAIVSRMDDQKDFRGWDFWFEGGRVGSHIVDAWPKNAVKAVSEDQVKPGEWNHVLVTYDGSSKAEGLKVYIGGDSRRLSVSQNTLNGTIKTSVPFKIGQRNTTARLDGLQLHDLRVYDRALTPEEVKAITAATRGAWLVSKPAAERTPAERDELYNAWLPLNDAPYRELTAKRAALEAEEAAIRSRGTIAHVFTEKSEEAMAFILYRGEYDKRRDPVKPATPASLPAMPADLPRTRLGFAKWLLSPEHPLTARVTVNRFWQELFGTGIVRTTGDFGVTGELPTHPELLDWLAVDFREHGWDIKRFYKQLVTSATYRQSAETTPEKREKDPNNRLLSRGPRFRMDAEMVRDNALAASGLLVRRVGGPSVRPYQPEGVWEAVAMIGSNTRDYVRDKGDALYRRSLYTFWKRAAPPASMDVLNAPSREFCTVRRERTNTPLQALVTLNDPQFVEAARVLAQEAIKSGGASADERIQFMSRRILGRDFAPEELSIAGSAHGELLAFYRSDGEAAKKLLSVGEAPTTPGLDPAEHAAWTMMANELMNLDEALNK